MPKLLPEDTVREPESVSEGGAGVGGPSVTDREPPADADDLIRFVRALESVVAESFARPSEGPSTLAILRPAR